MSVDVSRNFRNVENLPSNVDVTRDSLDFKFFGLFLSGMNVSNYVPKHRHVLGRINAQEPKL